MRENELKARLAMRLKESDFEDHVIETLRAALHFREHVMGLAALDLAQETTLGRELDAIRCDEIRALKKEISELTKKLLPDAI